MVRKLQPRETDLFTIVSVINELGDGRSNNVGSYVPGVGGGVTLTPGATTTTVNFATCSASSVIQLTPRTANAAAALAGGVKQQIFTSSGTYTPTAGMSQCTIECVGGGAGGGGVAGTANFVTVAGGGGAGGYSRTIASAAAIGASKAVTIGNAGNGGAAGSNNGTDGTATSVGTICIANGGNHGFFSNSATFGFGGATSTPGTGDIAIAGEAGKHGLYMSSGSGVDGIGGGGGASFFGGGALEGSAGLGGNTGTLYGSGGSGANNNGTGNLAGGNGAKGVAIITEFLGASVFVSSVSNGSFTITHANNAQTDRTFDFACVGG